MDQAKHYLSHFTTSTKVKSIQLEHVLNIILECFRILTASVIGSSLQKSWHWQNIPGRCWVVPHKHQRCTRSHWHNSHHTCMYLHRDLAYAIRCEHQFIIGCFNIIAEGAWKLKMHLTGVLVNQKQEAHAFLDLCEYPHDSNLTINIMLETLLLIKRSVSLADGPQVAFIQSLTLVCILFCPLLRKRKRFHFAVHLFRNESQRTSPCGKDITLSAALCAPHRLSTAFGRYQQYITE